MEALRDAVVAGEAPHACDLLGPVGEGLGEGESGLEAALTQVGDVGEQSADVAATRGLGLVLESKQAAEALLNLVDALEGRMLDEEGFQAAPLLRASTLASPTRRILTRARSSIRGAISWARTAT